MDNQSETSIETEAKKKAEAKATLLVRVIFTGLVVTLIAVMAAIAIYGEKQNEGTSRHADAADR